MGHTTDSSGEDRWDELSDEESVDGNGEDIEMASDWAPPIHHFCKM